MKIINSLKSINARRFIAYILDCITLSILSQFMIYFVFWLGVTEFKNSNYFLVFFLDLSSIALNFIYYILFWNKLKLGSTIGQLICRLKIKKSATIRQCIKRLVFMKIAAIYSCLALNYIFIRKIEGDLASTLMGITLLSASVMQSIYAIFINKVDKITDIEVINK